MLYGKFTDFLFFILVIFTFGFIPCQNLIAEMQNTCDKNSQSMCDDFIGMELVNIPQGCFLMGSIDGNWNEEPVHQVRLKEFYLSQYEVTQKQWQVVMGNNPSKFKIGDNYPVIGVSWNDVQKFIGKLNSITGRTYRLPTEAEWEYACRSGGKNEKYCGGNNLSKVAWAGEKRGEGNNYHHVGTKQPNGLGLYDMSGNVIEWVQDGYGHSYYQNSPINNPSNDSDKTQRVLRGGSWSESKEKSRSTKRNWFVPNWNIGVTEIGFRLALSKKTSNTQENIKSSTVLCPNNFKKTREDKIDFQLEKIPSGCFQMGSVNGKEDEKPIHKVCINESFELGKYEVTQKQWETIMGENPSSYRKTNNHPVERVSWDKVQEFIQRVNAKTGYNYRLPTEAEWEYACLSGGKRQKFCGGDAANNFAWHGQKRKTGHHNFVGSKSPNNYGLFDMSGNVAEWVQDFYDKDYYKNSLMNDPAGPSVGKRRSVRGGAWFNSERLRSTSRNRFLPGLSIEYVGFRLARTLP